MLVSKEVGPREACDQESIKEELGAVMATTLTKREMFVILERFWDDKTLDDIGKKLCVTLERVRQIEAIAFRKLRHISRLSRLQECVHNG